MGSVNDYVIGPHKHLLAKSGGILIDDSDTNCQKFRLSGGTPILFPQPWNEMRHLIDKRLKHTLQMVDYFT